MQIQTSYRPQPMRALQGKPPSDEPSSSSGLLEDKAFIVSAGATLANASCAGASALAGSFIPNTGILSAVGAGVAGAVIGAVGGSVINYKAVDLAESKHPSRNWGGLVFLGVNVMGNIATGAASGIAGHYGVNPLVTAGIGGGVVAGGLGLLSLSR